MCLACGGVHLVNPKTGKVLGAVEKENPQHTYTVVPAREQRCHSIN